MKNGYPRKRKRSAKPFIIALAVFMTGAITVALAYVNGDYSDYLAAQKEQDALKRDLRHTWEDEMPLISEEDYAAEIPVREPGDAREAILQTRPPNMIESQGVETQETEVLSEFQQAALPEEEDDLIPFREQEADGSQPAETGGQKGPGKPGTPGGTGETVTAPPHQIGLYTGIDLTAAKAKNKDFIAWITIPGTKVDYPVVLTDNMDYYLSHGFTGKVSKLGTLFSLGKTDYKTPGKNIAIYGHHITDTSSGQKMFRPLLSYKQKSFWENHQTIYLDSLYHCGKYRIFAVINMVKDEWAPSTAAFANDSDFLAFIHLAKSKSLYSTGVEVTETDRIITLITCDRSYASKDGRLVVMAVEE